MIKRICNVPGCNNVARKGRTICETCKSRKAKLNNPYLYHYNLLRCAAKRRGISFTLTLEEYKKFCNETGYMELKGRNDEDLSIDRMDSKGPYSYNNIRAITNLENKRKGSKCVGQDEDCPF